MGVFIQQRTRTRKVLCRRTTAHGQFLCLFVLVSKEQRYGIPITRTEVTTPDAPQARWTALVTLATDEFKTMCNISCLRCGTLTLRARHGEQPVLDRVDITLIAPGGTCDSGNILWSSACESLVRIIVVSKNSNAIKRWNKEYPKHTVNFFFHRCKI
jgi:hypothetical protein